jgi:hypothetical protein
MNEQYSDQNRFELDRQQCREALNDFLVSEDLAEQIDRVDAELSKLCEQYRAAKTIQSERLKEL